MEITDYCSLYGLVGYGVLVGIPVISTAWVTKLGFTEVEVGRVAGMDLGGLAAGSVFTAWIIQKVNRRILVFFGIIIAVAQMHFVSDTLIMKQYSI